MSNWVVIRTMMFEELCVTEWTFDVELRDAFHLLTFNAQSSFGSRHLRACRFHSESVTRNNPVRETGWKKYFPLSVLATLN